MNACKLHHVVVLIRKREDIFPFVVNYIFNIYYIYYISIAVLSCCNSIPFINSFLPVFLSLIFRLFLLSV